MTSMWETGMTRLWRAGLLAMAMVLGTASQALAQNAIQSINSTQQGGSEVVRIELSQPLASVPNGFAVQTPPRVALDLPGVANALGRSTVEINQGNLRSVNVAQSGDRTRLVLNLKQPANYQTQLQGKVLMVVLEAPTVAAAGPASTGEPVHFAESLNRTPAAIKEIDFRRGPDGAGRVVVELPNNQVGVDIRQQGQSLVVEFLRSTLPDSLRRRMDVTDFGTPVHTVSAAQNGDRVRVTVDPRGAWEHSAYQSDNQFVLEVRPQKIDPNKLTQGPGYSGEKLSLNFQNIEVRSLLQSPCATASTSTRTGRSSPSRPTRATYRTCTCASCPWTTSTAPPGSRPNGTSRRCRTAPSPPRSVSARTPGARRSGPRSRPPTGTPRTGCRCRIRRAASASPATGATNRWA